MSKRKDEKILNNYLIWFKLTDKDRKLKRKKLKKIRDFILVSGHQLAKNADAFFYKTHNVITEVTNIIKHFARKKIFLFVTKIFEIKNKDEETYQGWLESYHWKFLQSNDLDPSKEDEEDQNEEIELDLDDEEIEEEHSDDEEYYDDEEYEETNEELEEDVE